MGRFKIDYGIDLGTTNSAIARMENGQPVIKKTDTLKDTMPSCVSFTKKKSTLVGDSAFNTLKADKLRSMKNWEREIGNTHIEFKRTMGTDKKYAVKNMDRNYASEELSAEVLKTLKAFVADDEIKSVIITVPAKFTINQKDATTRAGKIAGFQHCELLQEPIAASMAYGLDTKSKNGFWLVFDFGGGTFDVALLRIEEGIMKVIDTEGDNYLGGKNLDLAIVDEIIIPYFKKKFVIENLLKDENKGEIFREAVKFYAEEAKIQMSFKDKHNILSDFGDIPGEDEEGNEFEIDLTITQEDMKRVTGPIFQKAINITKGLLKRNNIDSSRLNSLILVGGPTYSPILREMIKLQITDKLGSNVDPMTVVAKGAALYASTVSISEEILNETKDVEKIQLNIGFEPTTVEEEEFVTVKFGDNSHAVIPEKVFCEIIRSDKAWSSGKVEVGKLGEVIELKLNSGRIKFVQYYFI